MSGAGFILLADDNDTDAELTRHALTAAGITSEVVWVQDGEAALSFLRCQGPYARRTTGHPRLMLLDLHMPKIDGLEVLSGIKSDPDLRSVPVVVMSSSNQESDMLASYERHANSYIVKPVDFGEFTAQISILGRYWMQVNHAMEPGLAG